MPCENRVVQVRTVADRCEAETRINSRTRPADGALRSQFGYAYDLAENQTLSQDIGRPVSYAGNDLNELTEIQTGGSGALFISGTASKSTSTVTVNGTPRAAPTRGTQKWAFRAISLARRRFDWRCCLFTAQATCIYAIILS